MSRLPGLWGKSALIWNNQTAASKTKSNATPANHVHAKQHFHHYTLSLQVTWLVVTEVQSKSFGLATECHHYNGWTGYGAPSLKRTSCPKRLHYNAHHMLQCVFTVECSIARFLCAMLPLCQIFFFCGLHCWASPWQKIAYSITHSPSLFDVPGSKAFASE